MKRSRINDLVVEAEAFFEQHRLRLPPFGYWSLDDWRAGAASVRRIVQTRLGWDVTDFGLGDFDRFGLLLFTLRNGAYDEPAGKPYAEKIMIVRENQVTPAHCHHLKMEDIINRGGGELAIQLWNDDGEGKPAETDVAVETDGIERRLPAGGLVTLKPGESVTLPTRLWHKFWGVEGRGTVLVGEVSRVNDDQADNFFQDAVGRFPQVEEDQPPVRLLVSDYANFLA